MSVLGEHDVRGSAVLATLLIRKGFIHPKVLYTLQWEAHFIFFKRPLVGLLCKVRKPRKPSC